MWAFNLLKPLLKKVEQSEILNAMNFLKGLLEFIHKFHESIKETPVPVYLGLVSQMHQFFFDAADHSISLPDFTRHLLGLAIIHTKTANDCYDTVTSNFLPFIFIARMRHALQFSKLEEDYINVIKVSSTTGAGLFGSALSKKAQIKSLCRIEITCFEAINYNSTIHLDQLCMLIVSLRPEKETLNSLYEDIGEFREYVDFIINLQDLMYETTHSCVPNLFRVCQS